MANVNYNSTDIETVISNSVTISNNITSTSDAIDGIVGGVDKRVYDYFEFFKEMNEKSNALRWEESNANGFGSWMNDTYNSFLTVKGDVESNSGKGAFDLPINDSNAQFPSVNVDPTKVTPYDLTSDAWDKLSTEDKKVIEAKLKELGFTDEEIQAIKDGNASVNKTTLDKLCTELIKLNNNGSDVRQVILEKYGFDIFNEDGTINKDKLAYAMLIDNKDPNDDYDLIALLKNNYGIDLFAEKTPSNPGTQTETGTGPINPTPTTPVTPTDKDDTGKPNTIHTGYGYGGGYSGSIEETDLSEIENMLNDEEESLLDGLSGLSGSILNKKDGFNIGFKDGDGKGGAGAAIAGIAGLGAAATAAGLLAKKKKEEAITGDDDDDFDDELDEDLDEDDLIKADFDEDDEDDFDSTANKSKKKKDWLYGLGIGLAGAGLAAGLIAKDEEEDEDE